MSVTQGIPTAADLAAPPRHAGPSSPSGAGTGRRRLSDPRRSRLLFVLPAAVMIVVVGIGPLVQLGWMSLNDVTGATLNKPWDFVGFGNYTTLFADPDFRKVVLNTLAFVVVVTGLGMVGGFLVAVAVASGTRGGSFLLGMMVFVWALPPVINGSIWKFLLAEHGLVNEALQGLGLTSASIGFLFEIQYALWSVALVNAWAVIPFNALIFRASLLGIDHEVLEAAEVDGARPWQRVRYIMLPQVRPAATVLTVLTIVYAFRSFDFIYVMTAGGPVPRPRRCLTSPTPKPSSPWITVPVRRLPC